MFVLALVTAILLQVLSNLANDLGDHLHGTDNEVRVGPQRSVQSGAISTLAMKRAMWICGSLSFISGIVLIVIALGLSITTLVFLLIGLLAIGAAVKYTFGSNPYGYAGFGDISVLLFFGVVGVIGTYYLHTASFSGATILPAIGIGLLSTAMLNLNNMRDIHGDAGNGKRTLVVRMGAARAKGYHAALVLIGFGSLVLFSATHFHTWWQYLFIITFLAIDRHLRFVLKNSEPRELDPHMKFLALTTLVTALLFSLGLVLAA